MGDSKMIRITQEIATEAFISFALTLAAYDQIGMVLRTLIRWIWLFGRNDRMLHR